MKLDYKISIWPKIQMFTTTYATITYLPNMYLAKPIKCAHEASRQLHLAVHVTVDPSESGSVQKGSSVI